MQRVFGVRLVIADSIAGLILRVVIVLASEEVNQISDILGPVGTSIGPYEKKKHKLS